MANRDKGEVSLMVGETSYTLVLSFNAMIEAEDESEAVFGRRLTWDEIVAEVNKQGSLRALRLLLWSLLRKFHGAMTPVDAGALIDDLGGLPGLQSVVKAAIGAAAPDPKDIKELGGDKAARPRRARAGTGVSAASRPAASA